MWLRDHFIGSIIATTRKCKLNICFPHFYKLFIERQLKKKSAVNISVPRCLHGSNDTFFIASMSGRARDGQSAPIWSRLQFDPQSFEAPAPALSRKMEPKSSSSSTTRNIGAKKLQLQHWKKLDKKLRL